MEIASRARTGHAVAACLLAALAAIALGACSKEPRSLEVPKDFDTVKISRDGTRVAFGVHDDNGYRAVVDGEAGPRYQDLTVVEFSPKGDHHYYGGKRGDKWYLVRDGKEIAELGDLTSLQQATFLHSVGDNVSFRMSNTLAIWFAEEADRYFALCFRNGKGRIFKDGDWLPVEFRSFQHKGMAFSPDGRHYCLAVSTGDSDSVRVHLDGVAGPEFSEVEDAVFLHPGDRLVYRGRQNGDWALVENNKPLDSLGILIGDLKVSRDRRHLAVLVKRDGGRQSVVVDGVEETAFPSVEWGGNVFIFFVGSSFTWNRDFSSHAYVAHLSGGGNSPGVVVHGGKTLREFPEIRGTSLAVSDDGRHVAYAAKEKDRWAVVVDNVAQEEKFEEVGDPVFAGSGDRVAYAAKTGAGWVVKGLPDAAVYREVGPLVRGPKGQVAYAAMVEAGKWQVFMDGKAASEKFDGIISRNYIEFDGEDGTARFLVRDGGKLTWMKAK